MDEIDISLSMILLANSRIPYKELAEKFDMSVNSIHKRVKSLVDLGVIQGFRAKLGFVNFPGITNIIIFGLSDLRQKKQLINRLGENVSLYVKARLEWECYLNLGKIYRMWVNNTKAENYFLQSLEAVRIFEIGENIKEGEILESLAELNLSKGDIERAIEYYDLSSEIFYKFGDNIKNAELKYKIGKIYLEFEEDFSKAISLFEDALEIYDDLGYFKECAIILHKLGDIYLQKGVIEMAISYFDRGRNYYQNIEDDYNANLLNEKIKSLK